MAQYPTHPRLSFAERDAETTELFGRLATAGPEESEQIVEQIVHLYLDLCSTMAGRYEGRGIEHDDLVQVARLALVKAIRRYEPGHAPSFAAYAVPTISGELKRWFRDRGWRRAPRHSPACSTQRRSSEPQDSPVVEFGQGQRLGFAPAQSDRTRSGGGAADHCQRGV